ncbi:MAG: DUF559 domain-containing protein [Candidatus Liptonbacteria bacterium]|nr:DUF559 domain-containing protein [Candidatus Liptonbacteria bacterium]
MNEKTVLVGVLKSKRDQKILLKEKWYRIPVEFAPKRKFKYLAFYQPAVFGKSGKRIEYYGSVLNKKVEKRINLLPKETEHPRAQDDYIKIEFSDISKLPRPIRNIIPRRVCFGFTDLKSLLSARDMLQLYGVQATEQIIQKRLARLKIKTLPEFSVAIDGKRFRIDLAIILNGKKVAIECDNTKAHKIRLQKIKDRVKDTYLRRAGWRVIRLKEKDIVENLDKCVARIEDALKPR